ncbi:PREDICTED: dirigent protein 22-like [Tarenaya hassleriana]|uniref:dirigent protein 22-like n=1 Tax=Tarenaya hassleriana TaxID=28532 RepID=UPI00053C87CD|nr:PREDICTED: dirigent protein 22-like [Tarenaya hassleriana]
MRVKMKSFLTLTANFTALIVLIISLYRPAFFSGEISGDDTPRHNITHLHFFFHDMVAGKNPTVVKIAGPTTASNPYGFGATMMADDALTEDRDRSSGEIGRAQGIYAVAAQNDVALLMVMNFVFTSGEYKGSSLSLLGRNHVMDDVREMPVVGGSGAFRHARGYALAHTVWFDNTTGDATVEYNVYVTQ